eukprot:GFUD01026819.1.p1 GENE.GFUD01026819.1~~GFUD01026819.1.p1  ORF type:complete len:382 (-),score=108.29 GFUD01026819.1:334-1479(-)
MMDDSNSPLSPINMHNGLPQLGTYILGIIVGELFHRVSLFIEEMNHIEPRHKKSVKKATQAVFSNKHSQHGKVGGLLVLAAIILYSGKGHLNLLEMVSRMSTIGVVWCCLRMSGAFENSLEDMQILEESNAELGPGLAANYWFSFLKPALTADIRQKMEESLGSVQNQQVHIETDGTWKPQVGANYRNFKKIIILFPDDCHLKIRDERILKEENIFKCTEMCDGTSECSHYLEFPLEAVQKRAPIKQNVYWIYESSEYEKEADTPVKKEKKKNANKIYIIFDFPQLIQSAMGPDRGWDEDDRPGARKKNIHSFKKTLRSLLNCNDYKQYDKDVLFLSFPNRERQESGEQRKLLSAVFRERILEEETRERVYSSSSPEEEEA